VARLTRNRVANDGEFAILITDKFQRRGLGTELLRRLVQIGRDEKLTRITAAILPDNEGMKHSAAKVGFHLKYDPEQRWVNATFELDGAGASA
jgi:acetyltransferase